MSDKGKTEGKTKANTDTKTEKKEPPTPPPPKPRKPFEEISAIFNGNEVRTELIISFDKGLVCPYIFIK